jgi:hypothetical protein
LTAVNPATRADVESADGIIRPPHDGQLSLEGNSCLPQAVQADAARDTTVPGAGTDGVAKRSSASSSNVVASLIG